MERGMEKVTRTRLNLYPTRICDTKWFDPQNGTKINPNSGRKMKSEPGGQRMVDPAHISLQSHARTSRRIHQRICGII